MVAIRTHLLPVMCIWCLNVLDLVWARLQAGAGSGRAEYGWLGQALSVFVRAITQGSSTDRAKLTQILTRSGTTLIVAYVAIPVLLVAGIWLGFLGSYWDRLWIWVSLILLIGVGIAMTPLAAGPMRRVR